MLEQRVELEAFASDELVAFTERKLNACGIKKVVSSNERQADAYRLYVRGSLSRRSSRPLEEQKDAPIDIPDDLDERIRA